MEHVRIWRFAVAISFVVLLGACATGVVPADTVVRNVTIYTGDGRAPYIGSVAVKGRKIVAVASGEFTSSAGHVIDGSGKFLTPGLWDMHVHLRASEAGGLNVSAFPKNGVTSVRDLGGYTERLQRLQSEVREGDGPRIYTSYSTLNGKAFAPFQRAVTNEAGLSGAVVDLARAGAVQLKIHRAFLPELLPAAVRLAHEHRLTVTGHIPLGLHPVTACEQGMNGIEHVGSFLESYVSVTQKATADDAIAYLLSDASEPLYRCLASRRVSVTPTLVLYPAVALARGKGTMPAGAERFIEGMKQITARLHRSGVTLLTGTDASDVGELAIAPGVSLLDEMEMLQAAGIAPRDVLSMATVNAARALRVDAQTGTIEVGKDADFLVLEEDPGRDVRAFRRVFTSGRAGPPD